MTDTKTNWKKSRPAKIYDYNYKVSEGYYQPQAQFIEQRNLRREGEVPPEHKTYAERYAEKPWYGEIRGLPYDETKSALSEPLYKLSDRKRGSSLVKEIREQEEDNIPLHIRASRRRRKFEEEERNKGIRSKPESPSIFNHSSKLRDMKREMNKINDDFFKSSRKSLPHDFSAPSKTSVKYDYDIHRDPSGTTVRKSSHSERRSSYSSTSPNAYPSKNDEYAARVGLNESVYKPWHMGRINSGESSLSNYNRAEKFREVKRSEESREMAQGVNNLVDKLRISKNDPQMRFGFLH